jgi:hypothetical protein
MSDTWTTEIVQGEMSFKINNLLIKRGGVSFLAIKERESFEERGDR